MFGLLMNMLSPCLQRILYKVTVILFDNSMTLLTYDYRVVTLLVEHIIDNNWHVWYTDEHVVTLLAEHSILCLVDIHTKNFRVSVLHLKNIHTIISSLQNLLGIHSLQQLAFSLYHGGFVSWRVQAQEPLGQSKGSVKVS